MHKVRKYYRYTQMFFQLRSHFARLQSTELRKSKLRRYGGFFFLSKVEGQKSFVSCLLSHIPQGGARWVVAPQGGARWAGYGGALQANC